MSKTFYDQIPPPEGRKYSITANPDGTSSITDVTQYIQEGTPWSAVDANEAYSKANASKEYTATLTAVAWTGTGPYTQTVTVTGLAAGAKGTVGLSDSATQAQREAARDAILSKTAQAANSVTITADGDKPTINIPIVILEVG